MSLLQKDRSLNLKRSFYKFLYETLSPAYFINYSEKAGETLEQRIQNQVDGFWKWIELEWIALGQGIHSVNMVQINCSTIIASDPYGVGLDNMHDDVQNQLNVDSIPLLDFEGDPENPVPVDNVLIPRYRGSKSLPNSAGDTVQATALTYNIYIFKESVNP